MLCVEKLPHALYMNLTLCYSYDLYFHSATQLHNLIYSLRSISWFVSVKIDLYWIEQLAALIIGLPACRHCLNYTQICHRTTTAQTEQAQTTTETSDMSLHCSKCSTFFQLAVEPCSLVGQWILIYQTAANSQKFWVRMWESSVKS